MVPGDRRAGRTPGVGWILRPYAPLVALFSAKLLLAVVLAVLATGVLVVAAVAAVFVSALV